MLSAGGVTSSGVALRQPPPDFVVEGVDAAGADVVLEEDVDRAPGSGNASGPAFDPGSSIRRQLPFLLPESLEELLASGAGSVAGPRPDEPSGWLTGRRLILGRFSSEASPEPAAVPRLSLVVDVSTVPLGPVVITGAAFPAPPA